MVLQVQLAAGALISTVCLGGTGCIGGIVGRNERHPVANDSNRNVDPPGPTFSVRQSAHRLRLRGTVGGFRARLLEGVAIGGNRPLLWACCGTFDRQDRHGFRTGPSY